MYYVLVGFICFCVGLLVGLIIDAPPGYQDDKGFHYGYPEDSHKIQ